MQKLEEILRAEEQARNILAEAERNGEALLREASAQASSTAESIRTEGAAEAQRIREARIETARAQADAIARQSSDSLSQEMSNAEGRIAKAVGAVVSELVG